MVKRAVTACIVVGFLISGCEALPEKGPRPPFPDALQRRALVLESRGENALAERYWHSMLDLSRKKVETLQSERHERLETEMALARSARTGDEAVLHLLKVLRVAPAHAEARRLLLDQARLTRVESQVIRSTDTPSSIAGRVYRNVHMAPVVSALYPSLPSAGETIWLPVLEESLVMAQFNRKRAILLARKLYKGEKNAALLEVAEEILSFAPDDNEARYLKNSAAHRLAEAHFEAKEYRKALVMYRRVDAYFKDETPRIREILKRQKLRRDELRAQSNREMLAEANRLRDAGDLVAARSVLDRVDAGFEDRDSRLIALDKEMARIAEGHYRRGVTLFLEENLTGAIESWELSLQHQPGHANAREAVDNARRLLEKVEGLGPRQEGEDP